MKRSTLTEMIRARAAGGSVALATDLVSGLQSLVYPEVVKGGFGLTAEQEEAVRQAIAADRSGIVAETIFVQVLNPAPRLVIVGAVHIAQALAPMAHLAGYAVTIIDPRSAFATDARFPQVALSDEWPDEALARLKPDPRTAVVTLTHDPKLDDPALEAALGSPAFYIGALGSRKTHASRLDRLRARGFDDASLGRIHGPAGLDLGSVTQSEIALSILGQMVAVRRGKMP
jgi:xanthine dehydrogenase accessory factor